MDNGRDGSKRTIDVSLNEDLLLEATQYTQDLSGTLENLLQHFITRARNRPAGHDAALIRVVAALDAFHAEHGLLSDEFSAL